jgi:small subunit ribosomal protein S19e
MSNFAEVDPTALIESVAQELKKNENIKAPVWAPFVKTGVHNERVPDKEDWWFTRSAAILRRIAIRGPVGVSKLRTHFGGKKNRGMKPEKFRRASGNIIRKSMQQLEKAGLIKKVEKDAHKGRVITPAGLSILDKCAAAISKQAHNAAKKE